MRFINPFIENIYGRDISKIDILTENSLKNPKNMGIFTFFTCLSLFNLKNRDFPVIYPISLIFPTRFDRTRGVDSGNWKLTPVILCLHLDSADI